MTVVDPIELMTLSETEREELFSLLRLERLLLPIVVRTAGDIEVSHG